MDELGLGSGYGSFGRYDLSVCLIGLLERDLGDILYEYF